MSHEVLRAQTRHRADLMDSQIQINKDCKTKLFHLYVILLRLAKIKHSVKTTCTQVKQAEIPVKTSQLSMYNYIQWGLGQCCTGCC